MLCLLRTKGKSAREGRVTSFASLHDRAHNLIKNQHPIERSRGTEQIREQGVMVCIGIRTESLWLLDSSFFVRIFRVSD